MQHIVLASLTFSQVGDVVKIWTYWPVKRWLHQTFLNDRSTYKPVVQKELAVCPLLTN